MKERDIRKSYLTMRQTIGILGILLPWIDLLFGSIFGIGNPPTWNHSISATYYANSGILFTGLMFAVSLFLLTYKGYDLGDTITCTVAGIAGLLLAIFPCKVEGATNWNLFMLPMTTTTVFHFIFAGTFFVVLIYMIGWRFTLGSSVAVKKTFWQSVLDSFMQPFITIKESTGKKKVRNTIYVVCASIMMLCLVLFVFQKFLPPRSIFYLEAVLLFAFGISWLIKGAAIRFLND